MPGNEKVKKEATKSSQSEIMQGTLDLLVLAESGRTNGRIRVICGREKQRAAMKGEAAVVPVIDAAVRAVVI